VQHSHDPLAIDDPFNGFRTLPYPGEATLHAYPNGDVYQRVPSYYASVGNTISMYATANKSDVMGEAHPGLSTDTRYGLLNPTMIAERRYNNSHPPRQSRRPERAPQHRAPQQHERRAQPLEGNRRQRREAQFRGGSVRGMIHNQAPVDHAGIGHPHAATGYHHTAPGHHHTAPGHHFVAPTPNEVVQAPHVVAPAPVPFQYPQLYLGPSSNRPAFYVDAQGIEHYNMDDPHWPLIADSVVSRALGLGDYPPLPEGVVSLGPIHSSDPRFWASPPAWRRALSIPPTVEAPVTVAEGAEAQTSAAVAAVQAWQSATEAALRAQTPDVAVASRPSTHTTTEQGSPIMRSQRSRRVAPKSGGAATTSRNQSAPPAEPVRIAPPSGFAIALTRAAQPLGALPHLARSASESGPVTASSFSRLAATAPPFVMPGSEAATHTDDTIFGHQPGTISRPASQDVMRRPRWFEQRSSSPGAPKARSQSAAGLPSSRSENDDEDANTQ
jgi:hypothetical protein